MDGEPTDPAWDYASGEEARSFLYCGTGRTSPCSPGEHLVSFEVVDVFGNVATASLPVDVRPYVWNDFYELWDQVPPVPSDA